MYMVFHLLLYIYKYLNISKFNKKSQDSITQHVLQHNEKQRILTPARAPNDSLVPSYGHCPCHITADHMTSQAIVDNTS